MEQRVAYEIREIDAHGDLTEGLVVEYGRGGKARADKQWANYELWREGSVAAIYERVVDTGNDDEGVTDIDYTTIATMGDQAVLRDGDFIN